MYNGIGLQTARGSGTNGYVQRNLSFVKQIKKPIEYKSEDDFKRLERELNRVPNKDILEHQNKRQIELKCLEMEDQMEQQGFSAEEIEVKVKEFRESLTKKMDTNSIRKKTEWFLENLPQNVKETHKMAEMNHQKNDNLKAALAISPYFIEGSSLDTTRKAKEAMAAEQALQQKRYTLVKDPSPEPQLKNSGKDSKEEKHKNLKKSDSHKKRKSKKKSSESESDSEDSNSSDDCSKKRKKSKSKDKRIKDNKKLKTKDKKSRKYQKSSDSSSDSDSESDSDSGSSSDSRSQSSDSSDSSYNKSRNNRKSDRSRRERRKRTLSPVVDRNRSKPYPELKESTHDSNDFNKTSHSIAMSIRQMRKEAQNSLPLERQQNIQNEDKTKELSPKRGLSLTRRRYSRSLSRSSERDSPVKRLKSAVYEMSTFKKIREVPKSYDEKRYDSKKERSLSPNDRSRHSSRSHRSRSQSVHSYGSESSDRSSRSRSYSSSKSSSKASKSSSRSKSRSRSPSIPRRKGSPSFLDKRRITSARKRPIPYRRGSPTSSLRSSRSSRSMSGCSSRSLSVSSSDSFDSNAYKLI